MCMLPQAIGVGSSSSQWPLSCVTTTKAPNPPSRHHQDFCHHRGKQRLTFLGNPLGANWYNEENRLSFGIKKCLRLVSTQ